MHKNFFEYKFSAVENLKLRVYFNETFVFFFAHSYEIWSLKGFLMKISFD